MKTTPEDVVKLEWWAIGDPQQIAAMKTTPEDVVKRNATASRTRNKHAAMKTTPEDVVKVARSGVLARLGSHAAMKTTPEDVVKKWPPPGGPALNQALQ